MARTNHAGALKAPARTSQTKQADPRQVKNAAGGYVFEASLETQLKRFLILGTESGTYYVTEQQLTKDNAVTAAKALDQLGTKAVDLLVEVAQGRLAPRKQAQLFFLALALSHQDSLVKRRAEAAFPQVVKTGYDFLYFVGQVDQLRGWGRVLHRVLFNWFNMSDDDLVYQAMKYRQREGWSMRDVLRKLRTKPLTPFQDAVFHWLTKEDPAKLEVMMGDAAYKDTSETPAARLIQAHHLIKTPGFTEEQASDAIRRFKLPREVVPTDLLKSKQVWKALLEQGPVVMTLRNLGRLQKLYGARNDELLKLVKARLTSEHVVKSRVHPMTVYLALTTYEAGSGERGKLSWDPDQRLVALLQDVFEWSIPNAEEIQGQHVLAIDRSGSMTSNVMGSERISAGRAASAMAYLLFKRNADTTRVLVFGTQVGEAKVHRRMSLAEFSAATAVDMGGTDCSLPIRWVLDHQQKTNLLTILTDNETWAGRVHLHELRKVVPDLKIANAAMTATPSSLSAPEDLNSMDVVGFDPTLGQVLSQFSKGSF